MWTSDHMTGHVRAPGAVNRKLNWNLVHPLWLTEAGLSTQDAVQHACGKLLIEVVGEFYFANILSERKFIRTNKQRSY